MNKATTDLFDAALGDAYGYYQGLPDQVRFPAYRQVFSVDPQNWAHHAPPAWVLALHWQEYRYRDIQTRQDLNAVIPGNLPGIYIFYARPDTLIHRFPQFAFYVGISNEGGSNRPLRERLGDYVPASLSVVKKRTNVHRMLQLYYAQIWVAFALSAKPSVDLEAAEEKLHGYVHPCFGRRDFPVPIKSQQKAFGVT